MSQSSPASRSPASRASEATVGEAEILCVLRLESLAWADMDVVKRLSRYGRLVIYMI